ncbi:MAG: YdcF family protein [Planctomycetota bacterium]
MAWWKRRKNWDEQVDEKYGDYYNDGPSRPKRTFIPHLIGFGLTTAIFLAVVGLIGGRTLLEKTLTSLMMPCGMLWFGLLILVYFAFLHRHRGAALIGLACWLLLTVAGNGYISKVLVQNLEAGYLNIDIEELEPMDTVFLLGGGTATRLDGSSQVNHSGDRLVTAARLYHAGVARNIVCTGTQTLRSNEDDLHPYEEAKNLLIDLDVPEHRISLMRGANTKQEMENIKAWLDANPDVERIGIVSSAWHLPRVMRLAHTTGVEAEPVPANFEGGHFHPGPHILIPSAPALDRTRLILKETLARLVGR